MRADLLVLAGAFAAGTVLAALAGARNTGVAMAFGQLAFGVALVWVLVRRPPAFPPPAQGPPAKGSPAQGPSAQGRPARAPGAATRRPPPPPRKARGGRAPGR